MSKYKLYKEVNKKLNRIGRKLPKRVNDYSSDTLVDYYNNCENIFCTKQELVKFYEDALSSKLGWTSEDYETAHLNPSKLNTYIACRSFCDDINKLGEKSAVFGMDYKTYMREEYDNIKLSFVE